MHIKAGANRGNISAKFVCQHLLPQMLSQFAVTTNMLVKEKIPQNVVPTFINLLIFFTKIIKCDKVLLIKTKSLNENQNHHKE